MFKKGLFGLNRRGDLEKSWGRIGKGCGVDFGWSKKRCSYAWNTSWVLGRFWEIESVMLGTCSKKWKNRE